ncbi:MAG: hypothetical protein ACE14M_03670 [Terriglobales bacterium]
MKRYCPARRLLAEIEEALEARYSPRSQPVEEILRILQEGRNYSYAAVVLALEFKEQQGKAHICQTRADVGHQADVYQVRMEVPIKLPGLMLGMLHVETQRNAGFSGIDRTLLTQVAARLARFLATNGKYVVRRTKSQPVITDTEETTRVHPSTRNHPNKPKTGLVGDPASGAPGTPAKSAAAGDKSRP